MLGDVGDPQLVGAGPGEGAVDQVGGDLVRLGMAPLRPPRRAGQAGTAHQQRDGVVADHDAAAKAQLGMHPAGAVGAANRLVDLNDQVGQPGMADCAG